MFDTTATTQHNLWPNEDTGVEITVSVTNRGFKRNLTQLTGSYDQILVHLYLLLHRASIAEPSSATCVPSWQNLIPRQSGISVCPQRTLGHHSSYNADWERDHEYGHLEDIPILTFIKLNSSVEYTMKVRRKVISLNRNNFVRVKRVICP